MILVKQSYSNNEYEHAPFIRRFLEATELSNDFQYKVLSLIPHLNNYFEYLLAIPIRRKNPLTNHVEGCKP